MATPSLLGFWVGHYEIGGVFAVAETANRARKIVADELGLDYLDIYTRRVPALDGVGREGIVDWEEAKKLGAVWACEQCGEEFAVTARKGRRRFCGRCERVRRELGEE